MSQSIRVLIQSLPFPTTIGSEDLTLSGHSVREIVNQWLSGKSSNTQKSYGRALAAWAGYLTQWAVPLEELTWEPFLKVDAHQAKGFFALLTQNKLQPNTQRPYLSGLSSLYECLEMNGYKLLHGNVFKSPLLKLPKRSRQPSNPSAAFTEKQVEGILEAAQNNVRDFAIMALLFGAALRKAELLNLKAEDVTDDEGIPCIILRNTKTHNYQPRSVSPWVHNAVLEFAKGKHGKLFNLSRTAVDNIFKKYVAQAGIVGTWSPHDARCTVITLLSEKGYTDSDIINATGHTSTKMIEIYRRRRDTLARNPARFLTFGKIGK